MVNYSHIFEKDGLSYEEYRERILNLLLEGKTTGTDHSDAMVHYTKMNIQRMNRVDKTGVLIPELLAVIKNLSGSYHLLVISEGWCGDAAQIVPIVQKLAVAAPERFTLKLVWRDQQTELTDQHLTKGGRAIPILLVLNEQNELLLPKWGPRPAILQHLLADWKKEDGDFAILAQKLHGWYAKDKTLSIQLELISLLMQLK